MSIQPFISINNYITQSQDIYNFKDLKVFHIRIILYVINTTITI